MREQEENNRCSRTNKKYKPNGKEMEFKLMVMGDEHSGRREMM